MTSRPAAAQHLRDLARLRRVRDRIDREYAQPLNVEALARGAHMSAGHLSREFRPDPLTIAAMAERWAAGGWPCRVEETGRALTAEYSAPSAGPPPWFVYRITPRSATALSTLEPGGATRWRWAS